MLAARLRGKRFPTRNVGTSRRAPKKELGVNVLATAVWLNVRCNAAQIDP